MQSYLKDFSIEQLNINNLPDEIFIFFNECKKENLINNIDVQTMAFGKRPQEAWWVTKYNGKIISISGCHRFKFLGANAWRVLVRTATLKSYRGKAGPIKKNLTHDFNWGHILKFQVDYCKINGGTDFYFTTNPVNEKSEANEKTDKAMSKILEPQGYITKVESNIKIYDVEQNIWKINKFPF